MALESVVSRVRADGKAWALILGASSGFGAAIARELARSGMGIIGVHLDRRAARPVVDQILQDIENLGQPALFFNANASNSRKRSEVIDQIERRLVGDGNSSYLRVLVHSLAFGTLRPFIGSGPFEAITSAQMAMTLDVMAHSLVCWTQELVWRGLLGQGGRIIAMTSAGSNHAIAGYGAVSAAKAALEAHVRQLALELAPRGITVNAVRAGVTDTPALRKLPGFEKLIQQGAERNPSGRMTTPEDVARAIAALSDERSYWITGNVIGADGGEDIAI